MHKYLLLLLTLGGIFLSVWIVIPAPIYSLLPLSIGAPELSPGILCLNVVTLILIRIEHWHLAARKQRRSLVSLGAIVLAVGLSASPLLQFNAVQQQAEQAMVVSLGRDYQHDLAPSLRAKMRSQPLILEDLWRGIPQPQIRIERNIPFAYANGVTLSLNLYRPAHPGKYPGIISIYGGAWQRGNPDSDDTFNRYIAAQGYVVWAIDYRHAPAARFPAQLEDVRSALSYINDHATSHETNLDRMAIVGRSAGAQLAMLAAYAPTPFPIRAVVNYYGPVDLTAGYNDPPIPDPIESKSVLRDFLGGTPQQFAQLYHQASPINAVKSNLPPSLLIYGGKDRIIEAKFGRRLAQSLKQRGNRTISIEIPWADHAFDAVFSGLSNQLALYYTERFLAWELQR